MRYRCTLPSLELIFRVITHKLLLKYIEVYIPCLLLYRPRVYFLKDFFFNGKISMLDLFVVYVRVCVFCFASCTQKHNLSSSTSRLFFFFFLLFSLSLTHITCTWYLWRMKSLYLLLILLLIAFKPREDDVLAPKLHPRTRQKTLSPPLPPSPPCFRRGPDHTTQRTQSRRRRAEPRPPVVMSSFRSSLDLSPPLPLRRQGRPHC